LPNARAETRVAMRPILEPGSTDPLRNACLIECRGDAVNKPLLPFGIKAPETLTRLRKVILGRNGLAHARRVNDVVLGNWDSLRSVPRTTDGARKIVDLTPPVHKVQRSVVVVVRERAPWCVHR
jgi:hypothetical protein